jgi:hypothetical protein
MVKRCRKNSPTPSMDLWGGWTSSMSIIYAAVLPLQLSGASVAGNACAPHRYTAAIIPPATIPTTITVAKTLSATGQERLRPTMTKG